MTVYRVDYDDVVAPTLRVSGCLNVLASNLEEALRKAAKRIKAEDKTFEFKSVVKVCSVDDTP